MRKTQPCERCGGLGKLRTAEYMKAKRLGRGVGQRRVAVLMGIHYSHLSLLENGKHPWTAEMTRRFDAAILLLRAEGEKGEGNARSN